ncbi:Cystinosin-like protein [Aphelenchoides fujianensis]|nr:Cystinosin-like protein [Aphelenchoides fujianensis]
MRGVFLLPVSLFFALGPSGEAVRKHGEVVLATTPDAVDILIHEHTSVTFTYTRPLGSPLVVNLNTSAELSLDTNRLAFSPTDLSKSVVVTGKAATSRGFVDVFSCEPACPFNATDVFVTVKVSHSRTIDVFIDIVGWIYFAAWSVSFWPQIVTNFRRQSVVGLNFDFTSLNVLGFLCYSIYNAFLFFIPAVQEEYFDEHPRGSLPVTIPDLAFALHALFACIVTVFQCLIYERGGQRVSYVCMGWGGLLILFALGSLAATLFHALNWLGFITYLSYVKMAVSFSKYMPQAIMNFRRKSTVGWSIGNIILDFTGGTFSILQMVLIGFNTNDWSGFLGNPVKFGLGLISMLFDVLFMIQHFILYRHSDNYEIRTDDETNESTRISISPRQTPDITDESRLAPTSH